MRITPCQLAVPHKPMHDLLFPMYHPSTIFGNGNNHFDNAEIPQAGFPSDSLFY